MVAGQLTPPGLGLCASDSDCVSWNFASWVSMFLSGAFLRVCLAMRILHFMSRDGSVRTRVVCLGTLLHGCPWLSLVRLSGFSLQCKYVRGFVFLGAGVCDLSKSWIKPCLQPSVCWRRHACRSYGYEGSSAHTYPPAAPSGRSVRLCTFWSAGEQISWRLQPQHFQRQLLCRLR